MEKNTQKYTIIAFNSKNPLLSKTYIKYLDTNDIYTVNNFAIELVDKYVSTDIDISGGQTSAIFYKSNSIQLFHVKCSRCLSFTGNLIFSGEIKIFPADINALPLRYFAFKLKRSLIRINPQYKDVESKIKLSINSKSQIENPIIGQYEISNSFPTYFKIPIINNFDSTKDHIKIDYIYNYRLTNSLVEEKLYSENLNFNVNPFESKIIKYYEDGAQTKIFYAEAYFCGLGYKGKGAQQSITHSSTYSIPSKLDSTI